MKVLLLTSLVFFNLAFIPKIEACINSYTLEYGNELNDEQLKESLVKARLIKNKSVEQLNDYGVLLIYDRKYQQAIDIFHMIERQHPNLAKTAANLGTAYELNQQPEQARDWIIEGIHRDPNIHQGSEWIHVKILDAQLAQEKDRSWIKHNDVLGLDFGSSAEPDARVKEIIFDKKSYNLDMILEHSKIQMEQRLRFVNYDPITAQILFNMANIEIVRYRTESDSTRSLYDMAGSLGYQDIELLKKRQNYIQDSNWYKFKSVLFRLTMHVKQAIQSLLA